MSVTAPSITALQASLLALRPIDLALADLVWRLSPGDATPLPLAAALASRQLGHGHVCLALTDALLSSLPPAERAAWPAVSRWPSLLAGHPLVADAQGLPLAAPFVLDEQRFYLRRCWRQERAVQSSLLARASEPLQPPAGLDQALRTLFPEAAHQADTDWQQVACALAAGSRFSIVTGGPGTGKTTTVVKLLAIWQQQALAAGRAWRIGLAAPTGKAAARLTASIASQLADLPLPVAVREAIPSRVTTLHRLLGSRPDSRRFRHDAGNPLLLDVLVIDEASMIDLEMMSAVLAALPAGTRLVLLGDKDQLASVEAGSVFGDLCREAQTGRYGEDTLALLTTLCGRRPAHPDLMPGDVSRWPLAQRTVMLRRSWRFSDDSGIGRLARAVNQGDAGQAAQILQQGDPALSSLTLGGPDDRRLRDLLLPADDRGLKAYLAVVAAAPVSDADLGCWQAWAVRALAAHEGFQLLTPLRDGPWGVTALNRRIENWLAEAGQMPADAAWYAGRPVMVTRNDPSLGLMNGDVGLVLPWPAPEGGLRLQVVFRDETSAAGVRCVLPSRLQDVETVYAMTVHKSQGSEFTQAVLLLPDHDAPVLTRELVYTAITRARRHFTLAAGDQEVLHQAVQRRTARVSGLQGLWA